MLSIKNHRLVGEHVSFRATPNHSGEFTPRYLVFHYTAGSSAASSVASLCNPASKASAHVVLGRDGSIVQLAPFNIVTWHAGKSHWNGIEGLNHSSIGIEMDNAGLLRRVGDKFVAWFGRTYPQGEVMQAQHKHGGGVQPWHAYTEKQIARALELAEVLAAHYNIEQVLGHDDIAPGRKQDPGPAFPLGSIASRVTSREDDVLERYIVIATSLNIRKGPDASFDPVAPALKKGAVVSLLEAGARWSKVEVDGPTDVEGWVNNAFIAKAEPSARGLTRTISAKRITAPRTRARTSSKRQRAR